MSQRCDDACALHLFGDGQPVSFVDVRGHITACPDCVNANAQHVWRILTAWQRGITATHVRARR